MKCIDVDALLRRVQQDRAMLAKLYRAYQNEAPSVIAGLRQALERGALHEVADKGHELRGMLVMFVAECAQESCKLLEAHAKAGDAKSAGELFQRLLRDCEEFESQLQTLL